MAKEVSSLSDVYKKEKRRRLLVIFGSVIFIIYGLTLAGIWLVIYSPLFRIQKIEISGNQRVTADDVRTFLILQFAGDSLWKKVLGSRNILVWPENFSQDNLKLMPELKSIAIQKNYGSRSVFVNVIERQPLGIWCFVPRPNNEQIETNNKQIFGGDSVSFDENSSDNTACWWLDDEGVLFRRAFDVEGNLIEVIDDYSQRELGLGSKILPPQFISNLFTILKVVASSSLSIKEIRLNDLELQEIEVDTYGGSSAETSAKAGPKIYFSLRFPAANTLEVIRLFRGQTNFGNLKYLDFRVENRAYYK